MIFKIKLKNLKNNLYKNIIFNNYNNWGLGIGDWGVGPQPQTPNPQPQTPNPKG
jgi:hypothetical protein